MKKKKKTDDEDGEPKMEKKTCVSYFKFDKEQIKTIDHIAHISKNIYNCTIYCATIFYKFKNHILHDIINTKKLTKNVQSNEDLMKLTNECFDKYYNVYTKIKNQIENNNKVIYSFICNILKDTLLVNNNFDYYRQIIIKELKQNRELFRNKKYDDILFFSIIDNILNSFYLKNFNNVKQMMLDHIKIEQFNEQFIMNVKNGENLVEKKDDSVYTKLKEKLEQLLKEHENIKFQSFSQKYIIKYCTYRHLNDNQNILSSDIVCNVINRALNSLTSFFGLKAKGIKANFPKYLNKNGKYIIEFYRNKGFKIDDKNIRLIISNYIGSNLCSFVDKYVKLDKYRYIDKKYLKSIPKKTKIAKKNNFIIDNKYVSKNNIHIIDGRYITINLPKKLQNVELMMIELQPLYDGHQYKINYVYQVTNEKEKLKNTKKVSQFLSIDLGLKNLMTIYDPSGEQKIISGSYIHSINKYFNGLIDIQKSKIKKVNKIDTCKKIRQLLIKREQTIKRYFNLIVKWLVKMYSNKKLRIVIGYNKLWKNNVCMGAKNNRNFYQIPYAKLLNMLTYKLRYYGIAITINEESYTSKCDALALEEICSHEKYKGKRIQRGLFKSSTGKLINADLNGAINILRKFFNKYDRELKLPIQGNFLCNPQKVHIFREVESQPADNC